VKPILFDFEIPGLGRLAVTGYIFFIVIGMLAAIAVVRHEGRRSRMIPADALDFGFVAIAVFMVGARIAFHLTADLEKTLIDPLRIFAYWEGGFVFYGGGIALGFGALVYCALRGIDFVRLADVWAPAGAVGMVFGRIGCFTAGCCWGRPIDQPFGIEWPWAATFLQGPMPTQFLGVRLHPTQIYSSIAWLCLFLVLMMVRRTQRYDGQVFGWLLVLYAPMRAILELFRADDLRGIWWGGVSSSQIIGIGIMTTGFLLLRRWKARAVDEGVIGLDAGAAWQVRQVRAHERLVADGRLPRVEQVAESSQ